MKTLPEDFIQYTQELMGDELFLQLKQGITEREAPTSIRLNPFKCKEGEDAAGEPIPWCPSTGRYPSTLSELHLRSLAPCRKVLRTGSFFHVRGSGNPTTRSRTCDDARSLCGSRWKIYRRTCCLAGR